MRSLNSQQLGEYGEKYFAQLCAEAGLIANPSVQDMAGWDYVVEFPFFAPTEDQMLDARPQPPECRAQVKTVWHGGHRIKLRLSSAERLAKILQPACIFVLEIDNDRKPRALYAIHIMDDVLSAILKEVRANQKKGQTRINQVQMTLDYARHGVRVEISGDALKAYINSISAGHLVDYVNKKNHQIINLGVIGNRYSFKIRLDVNDKENMLDLMLGLKKGRFSNISVTEARWGIDLQDKRFGGGGEILFEPKPRSGQMSLRNAVTRKRVNFKVDVVSPAAHPNHFVNYSKIIIRSEFAEFTMEGTRDDISISARPITHKCLSLLQHIMWVETFQVISCNGGTMELLEGRKRVFYAEYAQPENPELEGTGSWSHDILIRLKAIVDEAGGGEIYFMADHINSQSSIIYFMNAAILNPDDITEISCTVVPTEVMPAYIAESEALLMVKLTLDESAIVMCLIATVRLFDFSQNNILRLTQFRVRDVRITDSDDKSILNYEDDMRAETGLGLLLRFGMIDPAD